MPQSLCRSGFADIKIFLKRMFFGGFCSNIEDMENEKTKSRASQIIDGDIEPTTPKERTLLNLRKRTSFNMMDADKLREISRKGQKAMMELHGEKKTARDSLKNILTLKVTDDILDIADVDPKVAERLKRDNPNATLYDLIQCVAVGKAIDGNVKAMEYVRDTHGDKPIDKVEISDNVMTESDRELLRSISARLEDGDRLEIVRDVTTENTEK